MERLAERDPGGDVAADGWQRLRSSMGGEFWITHACWLRPKGSRWAGFFLAIVRFLDDRWLRGGLLEFHIALG